MKKMLSWGGTGLLTGALLDPVICAGLGTPIPWGRELIMGGAGFLCILVLVKYRHNL